MVAHHPARSWEALHHYHLKHVLSLAAMLNSFVVDYLARQFVGGMHLNFGLLKQLPFLTPARCREQTPWDVGTKVSDWIAPRVLELSAVSYDMQPLLEERGYDRPLAWDAVRRGLLRTELDAAMAHLYGFERAEFDYIMDTFPIVRRKDEKAHGEHRTKRLILEIYDEMTKAMETGEPYQTRLDPPPADPSLQV